MAQRARQKNYRNHVNQRKQNYAKEKTNHENMVNNANKKKENN